MHRRHEPRLVRCFSSSYHHVDAVLTFTCRTRVFNLQITLMFLPFFHSGCDGNYYPNPCGAWSMGVSVSSMGECDEDVGVESVETTSTSAPLLGSSYCTYSPNTTCYPSSGWPTCCGVDSGASCPEDRPPLTGLRNSWTILPVGNGSLQQQSGHSPRRLRRNSRHVHLRHEPRLVSSFSCYSGRCPVNIHLSYESI